MTARRCVMALMDDASTQRGIARYDETIRLVIQVAADDVEVVLR